MFTRHEYQGRRQQLRQSGLSGLVLLPGADGIPLSSPRDAYPFRQDSSFAYFMGLQRPALAALIDLDDGSEVLFGDEQSDSDVIWHGPHPVSLRDEAAQVGIETVLPYRDLQQHLTRAQQQQRAIHYLPPYRAESVALLSELLQTPPRQIKDGVSLALIAAIVRIREVKSSAEIVELEQAQAVARLMHIAAMQHAKPEVHEYEVVAEMERVLRRHNTYAPYIPIFSRHGEILHNHSYDNQLRQGDLVVNDSGAASPLHYVADITRTIPVGGRFSERQRAVYEVVLHAQQQCIATLRAGMAYADVHRAVAIDLVRGLSELGLFRGAPEAIVDSGAYALCYPHGLGHQLGLDVHDMESYGEDLVGYDAQHRRSALFGLRNLRLAKPLRAGMVITVEPGIYFIPQLIQRWQAQGLHSQYINYERFNDYLDFGGIRIEDNVLIGERETRILGQTIPKTCADIEDIMAA